MGIKKNIASIANFGDVVGRIESFETVSSGSNSVDIAIIKTQTGQTIKRMKEYWMQIGMTYHERETPTGKGAVIPF